MCKKLLFILIFNMLLVCVTKADLVGWWKLDESSGLTAHDSSGNGNDGTLNGSAVWQPEGGEIGGALELDGTPGYVSIPHSESLKLINQGDFTITMWFRQDVVSGIANLLQQTDNNGTGRTLLLADASNGIRSYLGGTTTLSGVIEQAETWYHVAMIVTEGGAADTITFYINGEQAGTPGQVNSEDTVGDYLIGTNKSFDGRWLDGLVDDFRLYSHALDELEILSAMVGLTGKYPYAYKPNPADGTLYEDTWVNLSWNPGAYAVSHDVYMSDNFDDVESGAPEAFRGNQTTTFCVAGFPGFAYPDGLVPGTTYYWRIDEVNDLNPESPWEGTIWSFTVPSRKAHDPIPADGLQYVSTDVTLSWEGGLDAKLHTVYFGDNFDDVNDAVVGLPQTDPTYDPGPLEMDTTYYWRVDEFDGITTHKGDVWSFSTIPVVPETDDPSLMAWWTLNEGVGTTAVDWSGHGHHGTLIGDPQWAEGYDGSAINIGGASGNRVEIIGYEGILGTQDRTVTAWIKTPGAGDFISWGQNTTSQKWIFRVQNNPNAIRLEVSGGYIIGSTDVQDNEWHHATAVLESAGAPSVSNITLYLDGLVESISDSSVVDINTVGGGRNVWIGDGHHDRPFPGLIDDVRIYDKALTEDEIKLVMRIDPLLAWNPIPADGSTPDIEAALPLTWSPGDNASQHDVYLSTDRDAVEMADTTDATGVYRGRQNATSYTSTDVVWGGGPYYWRIDEVNTDGTVTKGRIWSFTVADFILVDDFESYTDNDAADQAIWQHWIDGFGVADNGAQVGYLLPPYTEQTIIHDGDQSMPFLYDNTAGVANSEAVLTLTAPRDWTQHSLSELSLWFRGYPASVGSFVEAPAGTYTMTASGADIWGTADQFHFAFKTLTGAGSIIARVNSVENTNAWAKAGVMIRETLDAGSKHAFACVTPENGVATQGRTATDSASFSTNETGIAAPHWVKLERDVTGNFTVSHSTNGTTWQSVAGTIPTNISMTSSVYIGLALTSHDSAQTCQAVFSNVSTTGNVSGQWAHQDIGIASNAAEPMYVTVTSGGASAVVAHDDPDAATIDAWTEWVIPLQALADQGVNLANLDTIAIGLGSRAGIASPGGSGTVYFDDIRLYQPREAPGQ